MNKSSVGDLHITSTPLGSGQTGFRLTADTTGISDEDVPAGQSLRFTYQWEKLAWHRPGDPPPLVGRADQPYLEITGNGVYRLTVIAHDGLPPHFGHSFKTEFSTVIKVDEPALRPQPVTSPAGAVAASIHENFPLTRPAYEFEGPDFEGEASWQLARRARQRPVPDRRGDRQAVVCRTGCLSGAELRKPAGCWCRQYL